MFGLTIHHEHHVIVDPPPMVWLGPMLVVTGLALLVVLASRWRR